MQYDMHTQHVRSGASPRLGLYENLPTSTRTQAFHADVQVETGGLGSHVGTLNYH